MNASEMLIFEVVQTGNLRLVNHSVSTHIHYDWTCDVISIHVLNRVDGLDAT